MRIRISILYLFIFTAAVAVSCTPQAVPNEPEIVLEGWIDEGGHPIVMLHKSINFTEDFNTMEDLIEEKIIYLGKVTVSDGETSVVLTGRVDTAYLPPYSYSSVRIMGESGRTYRVEAEFEGKKVSAVTTIPPKAIFDSISVESMPDKPGFFRLTGYLTDMKEQSDYFVVFYRYKGEKQYRNGLHGVASDLAADTSGVLRIPIYKNMAGTSLVDKDSLSTRFFRLGDTLEIKLAAIDGVSYRFWESFASLTITSTIPFLPVSENIYTNVSGGRGYWCGYGSSTYTIVPECDTVLRWKS